MAHVIEFKAPAKPAAALTPTVGQRVNFYHAKAKMGMRGVYVGEKDGLAIISVDRYMGMKDSCRVACRPQEITRIIGA